MSLQMPRMGAWGDHHVAENLREWGAPLQSSVLFLPLHYTRHVFLPLSKPPDATCLKQLSWGWWDFDGWGNRRNPSSSATAAVLDHN